jgi:hypothetical protein
MLSCRNLYERFRQVFHFLQTIVDFSVISKSLGTGIQDPLIANTISLVQGTVKTTQFEQDTLYSISFWHHGEFPNNGHEKRIFTKEQFEKTFKNVMKVTNTGN